MMNAFWTRGELAKQVGVKAATVRYYERRGLLNDAFHSANGYHYYDREALESLVQSCDGASPVSQCPILEALERNSD